MLARAVLSLVAIKACHSISCTNQNGDDVPGFVVISPPMAGGVTLARQFDLPGVEAAWHSDAKRSTSWESTLYGLKDCSRDGDDAQVGTGHCNRVIAYHDLDDSEGCVDCNTPSPTDTHGRTHAVVREGGIGVGAGASGSSCTWRCSSTVSTCPWNLWRLCCCVVIGSHVTTLCL